MGIALGLLLAFAAPASADIFGVAPVVAPGHSDIDVGLFDLSTGTSLGLPPGVNTPAFETHPTISTDGKRIAFERRDRAAGTDRLIAADLVTGQMMDLFNAFETQTLHPTSPSISLDGGWVTTGSEGTGIHGRSLAAFPNEVSAQSNDSSFPGFELVDPTQIGPVGQGVFAFRRNIPLSNGSVRGQVVLEGVPGAQGPLALNSSSFSAAHPSYAESNGQQTVVYDVRSIDSSGNLGQADIGFCLVWLHNGNPCGLGQGQLPPLVDSGRDESRPAFTPDGRYIGFIRDEVTGHERVYVFDTQTQTLIDPDGFDLGLVATLDSGNLSLYEKPVLKITSFPSFGTVTFSQVTTAPIGLLVQRVVGHHQLLGQRVPALKKVGRIPLGKFHRGQHKIHWRPVVNGHRLPPGLYQFTVRALSKSGNIRDLGRPRLVRIR
jgi:hypothetical protein